MSLKIIIQTGRFNGHLKELNFQNEEMELGNDQQLKVSNNMGIRYYLSDEDRNNRKVNINLKIKLNIYPRLDSPNSK